MPIPSTCPTVPRVPDAGVERVLEALRASSTRPRPCLLHADVHPHTAECTAAWAEWLRSRGGVPSPWARDAYDEEVEQAILARLIDEHAPVRPKPPVTYV